MGKLVFYDIKADGEKVQAMAAADNSPLDEAGFVTLHNRHAATAPALPCEHVCHPAQHRACTRMLSLKGGTLRLAPAPGSLSLPHKTVNAQARCRSEVVPQHKCRP